VVNEDASLVKYEPPKCDECGRKIVVLSDLCAKCAAGIELNGEKQANRPGTNPLPTWPKPPAPPNPPPAPAVAQEPVAFCVEFGGAHLGMPVMNRRDAEAIAALIPSRRKVVDLFREAPAVAVNEQLLEVIETVANNLGEFAGQMETQQKADQITAYASELFAAAESAKGAV
jgi:hypothetical protein